MKKILHISTGGTISSVDKGNGLEPSLSPEELIKLCPKLSGICEITSIALLNLDSTNMRPGHWILLTQTIKENYDKFDGFVITHGTDTMAYTASALSYLIQDSPKPIVLTGAQKSIEEPNTDAVVNLQDAFILASDDRSYGVQIVFFGSVITGTRARKNYSKSYFAFGSINYPEIAHIQDSKIARYISQEKPKQVKFYEYLNPNVGIIKFTPGMRNDVLSYLIDQYDGLVIETFGVGGIPEYSDFFTQIKRAVSLGKLVVMTTQVPNEGSNLSTYKIGYNLKKTLNILEAHDMTTESALCKLMWVLGQTSEFKKAEELFYTTIGEDILYK